MKTTRLSRFLVLALFAALFCMAAGDATRAQGPNRQKPVSGFRAEYLRQLDEIQKKLVDLAGAFPREKFVWRPGEGVRSVSEVLVHVAESNFFLPTLTGVKAPEGLKGDMERTVTEKGKVIAMLRQSFEHVRKAITDLPDARLEEVVKMYGQQTTVRDVYFTAATHIHEHLGQLIAYARMNGIVPPWTAEQQAKGKKP